MIWKYHRDHHHHHHHFHFHHDHHHLHDNYDQQVLLQHGLRSRKMERTQVIDGLKELIGMQHEVLHTIII